MGWSYLVVKFCTKDFNTKVYLEETKLVRKYFKKTALIPNI